jgi:hypothetical protein
MGRASMMSLACRPLTSLISLAQEFFYVMNLRAEAQLLCSEIGDGSRRLNKFGNKTRANMKSYMKKYEVIFARFIFALLHIIIEIWTVLPGSY